MKDGPGSLLHHIGVLFDAGTLGDQSDRQLLDQFTLGDRATSELAFTVLVKRHGPMVFRACRAILRDPPAAEDAFQATFLILARKSPRLWVRDSIAPWLLSVAGRIASDRRGADARRRLREHRAAGSERIDEPQPDDQDAIVREELARLPDSYRMAVLLCDLEGLTQEQAARLLGWPGGTVRSRLARGRKRLRDRLTRRGIVPAVALTLPSSTVETLLESLIPATVRAALQSGSGPTSAVALAEGVLRMMVLSQLKSAAAVVAAGTLIAGTGMVGYHAWGGQQAPATASPAAQPSASKPATLPAPAPAGTTELEELGRKRLEVALKIRDIAFQQFKHGAASIQDYFDAMKRYYAIQLDLAKSDQERITILEAQVDSLKQTENQLEKLFKLGQVTQMNLLTAELDRVDAEYELARFRAKVSRK